MKAKPTLKNIIAYLQGNYRYKLYYSKYFKWLLRKHIVEQIEMRVRFMDNKCYLDGQCRMCGCETIALQMATKSCDKPCYPKLMSAAKWKRFTSFGYKFEDKHGVWSYFKIRKVNEYIGQVFGEDVANIPLIKKEEGEIPEQMTLHTHGRGIKNLIATDKKKLAQLYKDGKYVE